MNEKHSDIEFVAARFPDHARTIRELGGDVDFLELCEHLALMCRLEHEAAGEVGSRFIELRKALESELMDLVGRNHSTNHQRKEYP